MNHQIIELLYQFAYEIKQIFGTDLSRLILYGSYARGDYSRDSDIDLMILVKTPENSIRNYADLVSDCAFEYLMQYGI